MKHFLVRRWFLLVLITVLLIGGGRASHLGFLVSKDTPWNLIRQLVVATVLFLMAWPLEASSMWRAVRRPWPPLLAVGVNFGLLPLFAWLVSRSLTPDLAGGLLVAASTPSTLASASVWTRRAGGNDSVAILVTMITNASCFLITPLWLFALTGQSTRSISLQSMTFKLAMLVVLPMAVAQLLRLWGPVGRWATRHKTPLSVAAQCGILYMVLLGAVQSGLRIAASGGLVLADWLLMIAAVVVVHLTMLWTGFALARWCRFPREDCIAVGFSGSQKTLMVGLQSAMDTGLEPLPMVIYHVSQLFIDTLIADRWRRRVKNPPPTPIRGATYRQ